MLSWSAQAESSPPTAPVAPNRTLLARPEQMIRYTCPRCNKLLESPVSLAGQKLNCPGCGQRLQTPQPSTPHPVNKTLLAEEFSAPPAAAPNRQAASPPPSAPPPRLSPGEAPPLPPKKAFGKVPAWVWYGAIPSVGLAIILAIFLAIILAISLVAVLIITQWGDSPHQRLLGTWDGFEGGTKHTLVFSSDGTMEIPSIDGKTNRDEFYIFRRLQYKWDGDHELVVLHTEGSAIRFNQSFPDYAVKARAGDVLGRLRIDFPSKNEMIITPVDGGKKSVYQRVR
jgi:hypothetical protein